MERQPPLLSMNTTPILRRLAAATTAWLLTTSTPAATTITIDPAIATPAVKRFGMNLSFHTTYDSRLMMKELNFRNPGFEGLMYQSSIRAASGTATGFVDDSASTQWPNGFWNNASFECIWGAAKGRTGTIADFTRAPAGQTTVGSTFVFGTSGTAVGAGDQFVLRKSENDNPTTGWQTSANNTAISSEYTDLPADTPGRRALHVASTGASASFSLSSVFDNVIVTGTSFIQLNGHFRIAFKAKSLAGPYPLAVSVRRGTTTLTTSTVPLATNWTTHTVEFDATENGSARGPITLQFAFTGSFDVLLDDVTFGQTNGDPTNTSAYRDAVVNALRLYRPGVLRGWQECLGESLDNQLAPMLARRRAGYSYFATSQNAIQYGYHEFLELCELLGAEPWIVIPVIFTPQEMSNFMEYLGGAATTPYGSRRAARGHPAPWTDVFSKIHIEFGNEAWNGPTYLGGVMGFATSYGNRASEIFGVARSSPHYSSAKYEFVLGAHSVETARLLNIHNASANHDAVTVDGYFYTLVDNFANSEELFGPLFAQSEQFNRASFMAANYQALQASTRRVPLSIYEGNINVTRGQIGTSQSALNALTPSLGAGLAVGNDMLMKLRYLQMRDQCLFSLGGYVFPIAGNQSSIWGVTRDMGVTDRKRPTFLATQLANEAIFGDLVQTAHTGDDPTWSQAPMNQVQGTYTAHHLHSYAFAAEDGRRSLVIFNVHRTDGLAVNIAGANVPRGAVTLRRLTSAAITDNNEDETNVAITTTSFGNFDTTQSITLPPFSMSVWLWNANGTVAPTESAPQITQQPRNASVTAGTAATLSVTASGNALIYQWRRNGAALGGATNAIFNIASTTSADAGNYSVVVTNGAGSATSNTATLTVNAAPPPTTPPPPPTTPTPVTSMAPTITTQPATQSSVAGQLVTFSVAGTGTPTPTWQWIKNGAPIVGATTATLTLVSVQSNDAGAYAAIATNGAGRATSKIATLTVTTVPPVAATTARLANLSVRTYLATNEALAVGIVVTGGSRDVLVRAAGPALGAFGLTDFLPDPQLEVYRESVRIAANDNWTNAVGAAFARLGAFAFPANSRDAALGQNFSGATTVRASGAGAGVVLVEAYDAGGAPGGRIVNLSALNRIGAAADTLIAGFVVNGTGTLRVLIRAVGPTLGSFGVASPLADPRLILRDARGTIIAENDDWQAALAPVFTAVGAGAFPAASKDAGLLATLTAGDSYTVHVTGANNGTGDTLVEIFEIP